jgi:hypothetical protein
MSLDQLFEQILPRFRPDHPQSPANTFVWGFIVPDQASVSVTISRDRVRLDSGLEQAEYLVYSTVDVLAAVFNTAATGRAALVEQLDIRPAYPFNNYLFSIFLNAFDLAIPDLNYSPKRFDGPFPFPPRYPAAENRFRMQRYQPEPVPPYQPEALPQLVADQHPAWVEMYQQAWRLAFRNLRQPEPESGFVANFIDPAFNANTYLWDSCFMMMFGRYARRVFRFMGTLDNFYSKQQDDGFICREINTYSGASVFQPLDPRSTGPNILAWTEWLDYAYSRDQDRLRAVFPVLIAFHRWWKDWRTHPDGSYWTSGWGSGMDNQTRVPHSEYHHRGYAWVDATAQQALNCRMLLNIAAAIDHHAFDQELQDEYAQLGRILNDRMWDDRTGFYYDVAPDGTHSRIRSIGAYWCLLTDLIPAERASRMIAHLRDPQGFNRPHRVPTQAYDSASYNPYGGYWLGGVWSPTNYMVLQALTAQGGHDLAFEIAHNHVQNIAAVFQQTGTLWENYAPEHPQPGTPAGKDFVGWTGVSAITIPLEYLIGLKPAASPFDLKWHIHLTERHGVLRFSVGEANLVDLLCEARDTADEPPIITIRTRAPLRLEIVYSNVHREFVVEAGETGIDLSSH